VSGPHVGVLAMAYGTPAGPEDLEAFYTDIRRGRPPTPELLAELRDRYAAIGGVSPLLGITRAQATGIERELRARGIHATAAIGMRHADPRIAEGLDRLVAAGVDEVVAITLAPHFSRMSVGAYAALAEEAAAAHGVPLTVVRSWHLAPGYLAFLASAVAEALASLPAGVRDDAHVVFTAHSLPERILADGDPYPAQLRETAAAVAERAGLQRWSVGWQSAGRTADPWIGPDVLDVLGTLAADGAPAVVVCAAGFVADHLEVLYDLDIEARDRAAELGIAFARTRSPNDDPAFVAGLADVVAGHIREVAAR
jgi:ferrochelatase